LQILPGLLQDAHAVGLDLEPRIGIAAKGDGEPLFKIQLDALNTSFGADDVRPEPLESSPDCDRTTESANRLELP
jgi:hypothetical protein